MSDLDQLINGILLDMENRRVTKHCYKGRVIECTPESTADILRRALEPLLKERDELKAKLEMTARVAAIP